MDEIMAGSIGVGENLPSEAAEAELCSRFDVSRTIFLSAKPQEDWNRTVFLK